MLPAPAAPTSRYSHLPRIFARAAMLFVPLVVLGGFLAIKIVRYGSAELPQISADSLAADWQTSLDLSASSVAHRPVFPYSIVPGGVRDARELQSAASKDPVVAAHYSDFRMALSRAVRLDHPLEMYVSYRRNNHVYWTRNRMTIPAGETVLSDGRNLARVRCGNRLSAIAAKPVAVSEPSTEELSTPEFVPPLLAQLLPGEGIDFFPVPPGSPIPAGPLSGSNTLPPPIFPPILPPGVPPIIPNLPVPPPLATPEPGALLFLFTGAAFLTLFLGLTLRRNGSS